MGGGLLAEATTCSTNEGFTAGRSREVPTGLKWETHAKQELGNAAETQHVRDGRTGAGEHYGAAKT